MIAPPPPGAIVRAGASELAASIARGELSAREVVEAHIARIEEVDPALNAIVQRRFAEARAEADEADEQRLLGAPLGPLHGVPITVKEAFAVAAMSTTLGIPGASRDANDGALVARLRAAGAIVLGKTNVAQLLIYNESDNPVYGRTNNPWDLARSPGGSSGGEAAAIAACCSPLGLGNDIGGSLRTPAHACGIVALKPTSGRLTNDDAYATGYARGQMAVVPQPGPMARRVEDLALAMRVLAAPGQQRVDATVPPVPWRGPDGIDVAGLRIGYYEDDGVFAPAPSVRRAVREAAAKLEARGARVVPFTPPGMLQALSTYLALLSADGAQSALRRLGGVRADKRVAGLLRLVAIPRRRRRFAVRVAAALGQGYLAHELAALRERSTGEYWTLIEEQSVYRTEFLAALDRARIDALLCPPYALPALTHGASSLLTMAGSYAMLYNLLGMPAGVVPVTRVRNDEDAPQGVHPDLVLRAAARVRHASDGLPIGVQIAARHWREDIVLAVMAALE